VAYAAGAIYRTDFTARTAQPVHVGVMSVISSPPA
jgi:hypothetical protein